MPLSMDFPMEWFNAILWLLATTLFIVVAQYRKKSILSSAEHLSKDTQELLWADIQLFVGFIGIISATLHAPESFFRIAPATWVVTVEAISWALFAGYRLTKIPDTRLRTPSLIMVLCVMFYTIGIGWDVLPTPIHFPEWFRALPIAWQGITSVFMSLLFAFILQKILIPATEKVAARTQADIDDNLLRVVQWPLTITILIIGIIHAISISELSPFWHKAFHGGSLTIIILLWTNAALHGSSLLLQFFLQKESIYIVNQRTLPIFHLLLRIVIVTASIYLLLLAWGINVMLWITSAGVIGIAVAYASQDTLSSLFAGVAILSDAPYRLNEYLILEDGTRGRVTHIGFRSTRLMTMNDIEIIIPNSTMANAQIINMSGGQTRLARIECLASVAYGSDIDQVRQLLHEIAQKVQYVIVDKEQYEPKVHFSAMAASSLDFTLRLWIDTPEHILEIEDQVNTLIYKTFQEHNIEIPYTKQDVYLYSMTPDPKSSSEG